MDINFKIIELPNGLRIIHRYVPYTLAVHCGYIINAGGRDDLEGEMGMAHFIEHMVFKGTAKRKTFHILNYLESVGGDINAYTTKEKTCLYASLASAHFDRATELLTDITFNSTFPVKEISKEKQVIAEEIDMYRNDPEESIFDDFDSLTFEGHSLGQPILGTKETLNQITREGVIRHLHSSYTSEQVVFAVVGNVTEAQVRKVVEKYLAPLDVPSGKHVRTVPADMLAKTVTTGIATEQVHEIIGGRSFALRHDLYVPFVLLNNLLGGPAMGSMLNYNIRERHGLAYNITSFYNPYTDVGQWGVYFACEEKNLARIRRLVHHDLNVLCDKPLTDTRLRQAKQQLLGQLTLGYENLLGQALSLAKDLLDFGEILPFTDYIQAIESVSAPEVQQAAVEIFRNSPLVSLTYLREA